jgi:hypothetical protein
VATHYSSVVYNKLISYLPGCHTRYYANYYIQKNKVDQNMDRTYYSHEFEFIHISQRFFMEKELCELFANMMVTSWYIILDFCTSERANQWNSGTPEGHPLQIVPAYTIPAS